MKKYLKFIVLLFLVIFLLGCNSVGGGAKVNYEIGYLEETGIFDKNVETEIIKTYDEWKKLLCKNVTLNLKYDEKYFAENIVVIYNFQKDVMGNTFSVKNVLQKRQRLIIEFEIREGYMDALSSGTLILELSKEDGEKIKDVFIEEIIVK